MSDKAIWLFAFLAAYWAFCLYWGLAGARTAASPKSYFLADRNLPAWIVVAAGTAITFNGWLFLGHPDIIFHDGFPFAHTGLGAVTIALGSVFFLKRTWMLGKRFGYVTPGEMAGHYFGGEVIRLAMLVVALVFAIPFVAMQLRISGMILAGLAGGGIGGDVAMWVLTIVVFGYVGFGGMRAAAYVGTLQGVLMVAGIVAVGAYAYWLMGGFGAFTEALGQLSLAGSAGNPPLVTFPYFEISGVIQYTAGLGVETPAGGIWTAVMIFSYCLALMGLALNPIVSVFVFSSRSPKGFAAQATWASAGLMGGVLLAFPVAQGLGILFLGGSEAVSATGIALGDTFAVVPIPGASGIVGAYVASLGASAPWFAALFAVCAVAAVQAIAAISASATSTLIVRDTPYRRYPPSRRPRRAR